MSAMNIASRPITRKTFFAILETLKEQHPDPDDMLLQRWYVHPEEECPTQWLYSVVIYRDGLTCDLNYHSIQIK